MARATQNPGAKTTCLAVALEKEGTSAFRFGFAGKEFEYGNHKREVDDLRAVIEHFNAASRVTSAILGHGKGGNVLLYASRYHDISTVDNISGRYDMKRGIAECMGEDLVGRLKEKGWVLPIHGSTDKIIPVEDALEFSKLIPNHKLHIVKRAKHGYTAHQAQLASIVMEFLKRALEQDKAGSS